MKTTHVCNDGYTMTFDRTSDVSLIEKARRDGQPLYEVRSLCGPTVDLVASLPVARNLIAHRPGCVILEVPATGVTKVVS